jgi:hypothetical protein
MEFKFMVLIYQTGREILDGTDKYPNLQPFSFEKNGFPFG